MQYCKNKMKITGSKKHMEKWWGKITDVDYEIDIYAVETTVPIVSDKPFRPKESYHTDVYKIKG